MTILALATPGIAAESFAPLAASKLSARSLYGVQDSASINVAGCRVGQAAAFFGVDGRSDAAIQYLTSGLQWRYSRNGPRLVQFAALQTKSRGAAVSGHTLLRATSRFEGGSQWYTPAVTMAAARSIDRATPDLTTGGAMRLGVSQDVGAARYSLSLFQADPDYKAPGRAIPVNGRGVKLVSQYQGVGLQLSGQLAAQQSNRGGKRLQLGQSWQARGSVGSSPAAALWELEARSGTAQSAFRPAESALSAHVGVKRIGLGDWRFDTSLGWFENATFGEYGLPLSGPMGRFDAQRTLYVGSLPATLSPSLIVGQSAHNSAGLATRGDLSLGVAHAAQNYGVRLSYVSSGFNGRAVGGDLRMMFHYSRTASQLFGAL